MATIEGFLGDIERGLAALEARAARAKTENQPCPVGLGKATREDPPGRDEVLIGVGPFAWPAPGDAGVCLNNKGASAAVGVEGPIPSITDLVLCAPATTVDGWRGIVGADASPERFFARFSLGVEDASPDSCFGLLCFLMRLAGIDAEAVPAAWVDYVRRWESGDVVVGDSPYTAYGCLHNALVHRNIELDVARSWVEGLRLLVAALRSGQPPTAIPTQLESRELKLARAFLAYEEQAYDESLRHTRPIQLAVPMSGTTNRLRLVDAYLGEETIPIGSLKAFARTDRQRSFLKCGFAVMGIYRPIAEGGGNDFTVSADPNAGIELTALWEVLERLEDERWQSKRPSDVPRRDMEPYKDGKRPDGTAAPNQPWYLDKSRTLIGAPKRLGKDGPLGTRLGWEDVLEALWQAYQPFRNVHVSAGARAATLDQRQAEPELRSLDQCFAEELPHDGRDEPADRDRRLLIAGWHRRNNADPALRVLPTLGRYLAACVDRSPTSREPIRLAELPEESSFEQLEFPGGVGVVTEHGAFLVDAGRHPSLPIAEMKGEFIRARKILHELEDSVGRIGKLLDDTRAYINGERTDLSDLGLLHQLSGEQIEAALELYRMRVAQAPPEADRFREALLRRWGIDGRLEALARAVEQIRELLQSHGELVAGRRFAFLQTYGLPMVVSAAMFGFVFQGLKSTFAWPPDLSGIHWPGLVLFLVLAAAGAIAIQVFTRFAERGRRHSGLKALRERSHMGRQTGRKS